MATVKKSWGSAVNIYSTNAYSSLASANTDVSTTELFSTEADLETSGYVGAQVEIKYKAIDASGVSDNLTVNVKPYLASWDTDLGAIFSQEFAAASGATETIETIMVMDVANFKIGLQAGASVGASNAFDIDVRYKPWRYSSA